MEGATKANEPYAANGAFHLAPILGSRCQGDGVGASSALVGCGVAAGLNKPPPWGFSWFSGLPFNPQVIHP